MANRLGQQFTYTLEKGIWRIGCHLSIGVTGAVTLQSWDYVSAYATAPTAGFKGVKSASRTSAGLYKIVLQDNWQRLVGLAVIATATSGTTLVATVGIVSGATTNVRSATSPQVSFQCLDFAGNAVDPASGETLDVTLTLQNSTAP